MHTWSRIALIGLLPALWSSALAAPASGSGPTFVTTWNTQNVTGDSTADNQLHFPLLQTGTYDFVVDWGDQTQSTVTSWDDLDALHTYSAAGEYQVTITGTFQGFRADTDMDPGAGFLSDVEKLVSVDDWSEIPLGNAGHYFENAINLVSVPANEPFQVTNLSSTFENATSFNSNIGSWNTADVTDMSRMFAQASSFNQPIGPWNTAAVTSLTAMFLGASTFNQDISGWNVSSVQDMTGTFNGASAFDANLSKWDTSSVTSLNYTFYGASSFDSEIGGWNTSSVTGMSRTFWWARSFTGDIGAWDTSAVTTMESMFFGAASFDADLSSWETSSVTNMNSMFRDSAFDGDISSWDVSQVTGMSGMFADAGLSTANYDALLNGWSRLPSLQRDVAFDAGDSRYSNAARSSRASLVQNWGWTITDAGDLPSLRVSPTSLDFAVISGGAPASKSVVVTNDGGQDVRVTNASLARGTGSPFTMTSECDGKLLRSGETCRIEIGFRGTEFGTVPDTLRVLSNAQQSPQTVALSGTTSPAPQPAAQRVTKRAKLPNRLKRKGKTVLAPKNPLTSAGARLTTKVTCPKRACTVSRLPKGKVVLRAKGVKRWRVKVVQTAPAVPGYRPYRQVSRYVDGKRRV